MQTKTKIELVEWWSSVDHDGVTYGDPSSVPSKRLCISFSLREIGPVTEYLSCLLLITVALAKKKSPMHNDSNFLIAVINSLTS